MATGEQTSKRSLDAWMLIREMSNSDLARAMGVSVQSVSGWASGKTKPREDAFESLCNVLQITADQIDLEPYDYRKDDAHRTKLSLAMRARKLGKERASIDAGLLASGT